MTCRAENGCFIKPLPDRDGNAPWINVVANFNLTWKAACSELLQYVRLFSFAEVIGDSLFSHVYS